jgi:RimJ/RimL family protein N-acetyltransferase
VQIRTLLQTMVLRMRWTPTPRSSEMPHCVAISKFAKPILAADTGSPLAMKAQFIANDGLYSPWSPARERAARFAAGLVPEAVPAWQACGMTPAESPGAAGPRSTPPVRIVHVSAAAFRALADGDLAAANAASPVPLTEYFVTPEWRGTWRMRSEQVIQNQASAAWVTGVIWAEDERVAVGRAGYHGPPDEAGMVEIGYAVDPAYRRRGYARAALEALLARATREPLVKVVRATISPDNTASYALVAQYGFSRTGEQWDDEDGLEIIYEVPAGWEN